MSHTITWHGNGRKAVCPPNPNYPDGIDVGFIPDRGNRLTVSCKVKLPYPAAEVGHWVVRCADCDQVVACTAAGRPDDPRSLTMMCKTKKPSWDKQKHGEA